MKEDIAELSRIILQLLSMVEQPTRVTGSEANAMRRRLNDIVIRNR